MYSKRVISRLEMLLLQIEKNDYENQQKETLKALLKRYEPIDAEKVLEDLLSSEEYNVDKLITDGDYMDEIIFKVHVS